METKMVVVMRADLKDTKGQKVRTGKIMAQAGHAVSNWLVKRLAKPSKGDDMRSVFLNDEEERWVTGDKQRKVCLKVPNEAALLAIYQRAVDAGLQVHLVTDAGLTQFAGPTNTCIGIGPHDESRIDAITGDLELF